MNNIFSEFAITNYSDWLKKIELDLKGKPLSVLSSNPEPDLEIVAYHHPETCPPVEQDSFARNLTRLDNSWNIRQEFNATSDVLTNEEVLNSLNQGVNHVGLFVNDETNFEALSKGILFQHIDADIRFETRNTALNFNDNAKCDLNFDVISLNANCGEWKFTLADFGIFFRRNKDSKKCWISGYQYGFAGASTLQELAFTANHINEYIHYLTSQEVSLEEINSNLIVELSINDNYFVNIAKIRVMRQLVQLVFEGYDPDFISSPIKIYSKTNIRHMSKNDSNNNPLRATTQAMSAVMGGCNVLTVDYDKKGDEKTVKHFERIAKNIQLILKEEAYLDKVIDPSSGSYYLESLTEQLLQKSWTLFQTVENNGGLINGLKTNEIQSYISNTQDALIENLNTNKSTFLGINKYPNGMEDWTNLTVPNPPEGNEFKPLAPFYLENHYKKEEVN